MTTLLQTLCEHAQKTRAPALLTGGEYEELCGLLDRQRERVAALLRPDGLQAWEDFQRDAQLLQSMDLEAMFQAGLSVGLELSRV